MLAAFVREGVFVGADAMPLFDEQGKVPAWDDASGVGKGHPRSAGTHAKILRMVREEQLIPLMEAIAKLSYLQAKFLEDMVPDMSIAAALNRARLPTSRSSIPRLFARTQLGKKESIACPRRAFPT